MVKKNETNDLEKSFGELEQITQELQEESLDLEDALSKFERGLKLSELIKTRLSEVENHIERIRLKFSEKNVGDNQEK